MGVWPSENKISNFGTTSTMIQSLHYIAKPSNDSPVSYALFCNEVILISFDSLAVCYFAIWLLSHYTIRLFDNSVIPIIWLFDCSTTLLFHHTSSLLTLPGTGVVLIFPHGFTFPSPTSFRTKKKKIALASRM